VSNRLVASHYGEAVGIKQLELDSHADTCLFGKDALLLYQTDESVEVSGFHPSLQKLTNIPIALVAVAYNDPVTNGTWMLEFHQVLYFATDKQRLSTHAITAGELIIPLKMVGIWLAFEFRTPTMDEWRESVNKIKVTSPTVQWDPHSDYFASRECKYNQLTLVLDTERQY
jgi:hypothetical protein